MQLVPDSDLGDDDVFFEELAETPLAPSAPSGDGNNNDRCSRGGRSADGKGRGGKGKHRGGRGSAIDQGLEVLVADQWRKCPDCGKHKAVAEFNKDQGRCKLCYNHRRSFSRYLQVQNAEADMGVLERQDPSVAITVFRNFCKARDKRQGVGNKVKLNLLSYLEEVRVQRGQRVQHEGR